MISSHQIDLVIFDCDGVLVDSEPLANRVMAEHISRLGWPMDGAETIRRFKGHTMAQVHQTIETHLGRTIDPIWREAFHRDQEALMATDLKAVPGIEALIARVHAAGLKSCVASQGRHAKMQISLGATGLWPIFEGRIFSASDVARPKPFPDLFEHAARQMGVAPSRCMVIEDSATGVRAALAAKMAVIAYDADGSGVSRQDTVPSVSDMNAISVG